MSVMLTATRVCPKCGEERHVADFARDASKASGRKSLCRPCDNAKSARYYAANRDRVIARVLERVERRTKICERCKTAPASSSRHHYCDSCRERVAARDRSRARRRELERTKLRGTSTERGYGAEHQRMRRAVARTVELGLAVCARCGQPIAAREPWDLGHDDVDRSRYAGPEHRRCNRATSSHARARVSRRW